MSDRWHELREFVSRWYRDPLQPSDVLARRFAKLGPPALVEWFELVGERPQETFLSFPDPEVFSTWPQVPKATRATLASADSERGVLPLVVCGGHGGWGVDVSDPLPDPPVTLLELEGETSEPFEGSLSSLLTAAVIVGTVCNESPLGPLAEGVRCLDPDQVGSELSAYLCGGDFEAGFWTFDGGELRQDAAGEVLVFDSGEQSVLVHGDSAWERIAALPPPEPSAPPLPRGDAERGAELLERLEAACEKLLRFERAFLDDFRRQVRSGSPPASLLTKAAEILAKRE